MRHVVRGAVAGDDDATDVGTTQGRRGLAEALCSVERRLNGRRDFTEVLPEARLAESGQRGGRQGVSKGTRVSRCGP
jgi:hypothetical protein